MSPLRTSAPHARNALDVEIHDTVLIAAAFCMYNRYVDGLDTWQQREQTLYLEREGKRARGQCRDEQGVLRPAEIPEELYRPRSG